MEEQAAERLAVGEGLVTHLTSLVLVDEEGASQTRLPVIRKLLLPSPRTYQTIACCIPQAFDAVDLPAGADNFVDGPQRWMGDRLELIGQGVDWDANANALIEGNLDSEEAWVAASLKDIARGKVLRALAPVIGLGPIQVAVAIVADAVATSSHGAARVKRHLLRNANRKLFGLFSGVYDLIANAGK